MTSKFENIYEAYCPMLYNIALQVCSTHQKAEEILLLSFKKVYWQKIEWMDKSPFCIDLIKLILQTAKEELYPGETNYSFTKKQFEKTPLLHKLFVEQLTLENYCIENKMERSMAISIIRNEFKVILNTSFYPEKTLNVNIRSFQFN